MSKVYIIIIIIVVISLSVSALYHFKTSKFNISGDDIKSLVVSLSLSGDSQDKYELIDGYYIQNNSDGIYEISLSRPIYSENKKTFVWLNEYSGGTGRFYYVARVFKDKEEGKYRASEGYYIGDRIKPGDITITKKGVIIEFYDRKENETFADYPTVKRKLELPFSEFTKI